jgi:hypothetical protein
MMASEDLFSRRHNGGLICALCRAGMRAMIFITTSNPYRVDNHKRFLITFDYVKLYSSETCARDSLNVRTTSNLPVQ